MLYIAFLHTFTFEDVRRKVKLIYFQIKFGMSPFTHLFEWITLWHAWGAQTCPVVAGSSFPLSKGVPPSSDAGLTGEEAMFQTHKRTHIHTNSPQSPAYNWSRFHFLLSLHHSAALPYCCRGRNYNAFPSKHSDCQSGFTVQLLSLLQPVLACRQMTFPRVFHSLFTYTHRVPLLPLCHTLLLALFDFIPALCAVEQSLSRKDSYFAWNPSPHNYCMSECGLLHFLHMMLTQYANTIIHSYAPKGFDCGVNRPTFLNHARWQ